jgi:hypothetical protein
VLIVDAAVIVAAVAVIVWLLWPSPSGALVLHSGSPDHIVTVTIDSPRAGDTDIEIELTDRSGNPIDHAALRIQPIAPLAGHAGPALPARYAGPGRYHAVAVPLMMTGPWELRLSIDDADHLTVPLWIGG